MTTISTADFKNGMGIQIDGKDYVIVEAGTKPAKIATGATIQVPMFLNIGDVIKVDTREGGKYVSRV